MKKITRIFMMLLICFAFAGCSNKEMGTSASNTIEKNEMQNTATGNGISEVQVSESLTEDKVSYQCDAGSISFYLPDGWSHKINKYKKISDDKTWGDNETFEITFWKKKAKKNKICIQYTKHFGACGTGAEAKKTKINGMSAEAVYYDGKPYWEYIYFLKEYENFVILNFCEDENWWTDNGDQVMEILDTLTLDKNT